MYRAFYNIIRLDQEVTSQDASEVELADVYSKMLPLMKEDREFFGLIDSQGTTLQAMYDEDADQYWFEVPRPDLQGSFGASLSMARFRKKDSKVSNFRLGRLEWAAASGRNQPPR